MDIRSHHEVPKTDALWLVHLEMWFLPLVPLFALFLNDSLLGSAPQRSAGWRVERRQQRWGWSCQSVFPAKQVKQCCSLNNRMASQWRHNYTYIRSVVMVKQTNRGAHHFSCREWVELPSVFSEFAGGLRDWVILKNRSNITWCCDVFNDGTSIQIFYCYLKVAVPHCENTLFQVSPTFKTLVFI